MGRKIFISYARENSADAKKLANLLEERDYAVWLDQFIKGGDEWEDAIKEALDWATDVVVILTPASAESKWVNFEATTAKAKEDTAVHPVIIQSFDVEAYPIWARGIQHHDFYNKEYLTALEDLCAALGKPDPVQGLLDHRVLAYQKTGALISEEDLERIEAKRQSLTIDAEAEALIRLSHKRVESLRQGAFWRVATGALGCGIGFACTYLFSIGRINDYGTLLPILAFYRFLIGAVAGVLFVILIDFALSMTRERFFKLRWLFCGLGGSISFGLAASVHAYLHASYGFSSLLLMATEGIVWGFVIGLGAYLVMALKISSWIPLLGTALVAALAFGLMESVVGAFGNVTHFAWILFVGSLLPLFAVIAGSSWRPKQTPQ